MNITSISRTPLIDMSNTLYHQMINTMLNPTLSAEQEFEMELADLADQRHDMEFGAWSPDDSDVDGLYVFEL